MELRQITEQNPWWEDRERINEDEKVKEALSKRQKIVFAFKNKKYIFFDDKILVGKDQFEFFKDDMMIILPTSIFLLLI
jgi:hypothetical protein